VETKKGSRRTRLSGKLTDDLYRQIAHIYSNFVTRDDAKDMVLARLIKKHPDDALWLMARLYFARKVKSVVTFEYRGNLRSSDKKYAIHPYHMVFRNNNLYLVGMNETGGNIQLFILNKVNRLEVTARKFTEPIPSVEVIFQDTLGSFRGKKYGVELHFDEALRPQIEEILSVLEPKIEPLKGGGRFKASFLVSDDLYLCKQLFMYGSRVEIVKPKELRATMLDLLEQGLGIYKK
jgi:predicted DNA-binding transcriptional regulator YafY